MKLWKLLGAILEEKSLNKRMDKEGARGLTCLWNEVCINQWKERAYVDGKAEEVDIGRLGREVTDGGRVSAQSEMVVK